jgi:hypothetical protein
MLPPNVTLSRLSRGEPRFLIRYIETENPSLLQGMASSIGKTGGLAEQWTTAVQDRANAYKNYYLDPANPNNARKAEVAANRAELIGQAVGGVLSAARYEQVRHEFEGRSRWLLTTVLATALAIVGFAWSANPPSPKQAPAVLRGASLVGVDLRGANLTNADLTKADLTNANLTGANLAGSEITGVRWSHTICPDGIKSSEVRPEETCAGHLVPATSP